MSKLPETGPSLVRHLRQQQRRMIRAENASPFSRSGSGVTAVDEVTYEGVLKILGQMVVDGTLTVNGPLTVTQTADITGTTHIGGATDIDGTLNVDAAATFGGPMAVTGTLSLPAGIIDNAALASPVSGDTATTYVAGLPLNATRQSVAAVSVNVPAGFSVARVMAVSTLSAGSSAIDCITRIQGNDGGVVTAGYGFAASSHAITLTGLSGGTITASTLAASWPDTSGRANTTIFVVFLR